MTTEYPTNGADLILGVAALVSPGLVIVLPSIFWIHFLLPCPVRCLPMASGSTRDQIISTVYIFHAGNKFNNREAMRGHAVAQLNLWSWAIVTAFIYPLRQGGHT